MKYDFDAYPRNRAMAQNTSRFGAEVEALGRALSHAETSGEKVRLLAKLTKLASEDAGAVTFMSNSVHAVVGSGGAEPGTGAVLSMLVPRSEVECWKIPVLFQEDLDVYLLAIVAGIEALKTRLPEALKELQNKQHVHDRM